MKLIYFLMLLITLIFVSTSCNENEWLEEIPVDFLSPENAFATEADFDNAIAQLHWLVYNSMMDVDAEYVKNLFYPSDIMYNGESVSGGANQFKNVMFPTYENMQTNWKNFYRLVFDANAIIDRVDNPEISFNSEAARNEKKGEALFFRAFAYRNLASLWGGVPLILNEITTPKRDFIRNTRQEVWEQCIEDLEFASRNLPEIDAIEDGRISNAAAYHLLSEIYINAGNYPEAITAATAVIDNPKFGLMRNRFGKRSNDPGDVYWDLFRRDNQNHNAANNTEAIWVRQYEHGKMGGGSSSRWAVQGQTYYSQLVGNDGQFLFIMPVSAKYGGRGVGIIVMTDHMNNTIWESDFYDDMRNSEHNIYRDIIANNPNSAYYGQYIVANGTFTEFNNAMNRWWTQIYTKVTPIGDEFPAEQYVSGTPSEEGAILNQTQNSYTDSYLFRLPETYLLRAEAYLLNGQPEKAAADINQVRGRANATPVVAEDVTLDYILDERARELVYEEFRVITLMRMGKFVERVRKYNPYSTDYVDDYHNLWPIPQNEIENNIGAELEQNPGYPKTSG